MVRIAVVGDVHNVWSLEKDLPALRHLKPDVVLFTGDFGNEDVELVTEISQLNMPKAVILGNHDCWWSALTAEKGMCFNDRTYSGAVADQIKALGDSHVGFKRKDFKDLKLSVVGARPFTIGGHSIFGKIHVSHFFGIEDMEASTRKITELVLDAPTDHSVVILGHNGPTGLGARMDDICGKDFARGAGDHGDPDLEEALERVQGRKKIPLVVFGHMHHRLQNGGSRKMVATKRETVFVNAAVVPRERKESLERQFTMVELSGDQVSEVKDTWVRVPGANSASLAGETLLYP